MSKYFVYGGSFNPLHKGHENIIAELLESNPESKVIVLPSYASPLKEFDYDPGIEQRVKLINARYSSDDRVLVDDTELLQNKKCYTIELLPILFEKYATDDLTLVIGADQLLQFHKWKDFAKILELANLIVVSRPGYNFLELEELNPELLNEISNYENETFLLDSGLKISYLELKDNYDVSSSQIRSHIRKGKNMDGHLSEEVNAYLRSNEIYQPVTSKVESYEEFTKDCFQMLKEKNALGIMAYDVRSITQPSEFNLIASATNVRQTSAIAENLIRTVRKKYALSPVTVEGMGEGRWVVIDYGSLIVHIFYDFIRSEYNLEELWSKGVLLESEE